MATAAATCDLCCNSDAVARVQEYGAHAGTGVMEVCRACMAKHTATKWRAEMGHVGGHAASHAAGDSGDAVRMGADLDELNEMIMAATDDPMQFCSACGILLTKNGGCLTVECGRCGLSQTFKGRTRRELTEMIEKKRVENKSEFEFPWRSCWIWLFANSMLSYAYLNFSVFPQMPKPGVVVDDDQEAIRAICEFFFLTLMEAVVVGELVRLFQMQIPPGVRFKTSMCLVFVSCVMIFQIKSFFHVLDGLEFSPNTERLKLAQDILYRGFLTFSWPLSIAISLRTIIGMIDQSKTRTPVLPPS